MKKVKLGDVCKIQSGGTPSRGNLNYWNNGNIPWVKISDIKEKHLSRTEEFITQEGLANSSAKIFPKETILYTIFATLGEVSILEIEATTNQAIVGLQIIDENICKDYLYYYLISLKPFVNEIGRGVAQNNINMQILRNFEIPLPSLEEQKAIARKLDKVSGLIEKRKTQLEKLSELVKSRFIEMFGSEENKIPISEMCNVTGGYSFKSDDISDDGAIKILQIGNVYLDNVSWETTNYLPEGFDEKYSKFMLNEGDIVVALTRPIIQSLGNVKACIVKSSDLPCLLNQRVGRIVAKKEKSVFLDFIYGCLMTDDFTRYVETYSIGCSQPNISTKDIENFLIPNATYEEQKVYVEFKKQTDKSKLVIQKSLEKLETLKKALMQKYFG
ncbi:MAG: restriction endonuclease subunit S [Fibrobacteraceae bacterium]|nr:restriction endonuclease subunit S [Fibrobacteraceae bacterium]